MLVGNRDVVQISLSLLTSYSVHGLFLSLLGFGITHFLKGLVEDIIQVSCWLHKVLIVVVTSSESFKKILTILLINNLLLDRNCSMLQKKLKSDENKKYTEIHRLVEHEIPLTIQT